MTAGIEVKKSTENDESFGKNCWSICIASPYAGIWEHYAFPHHITNHRLLC